MNKISPKILTTMSLVQGLPAIHSSKDISFASGIIYGQLAEVLAKSVELENKVTELENDNIELAKTIAEQIRRDKNGEESKSDN